MAPKSPASTPVCDETEATLMLLEVTPGEPCATLLGQAGTEALAAAVGDEDEVVSPPPVIGNPVVTGDAEVVVVVAVEEFPLPQADAITATETITMARAPRPPVDRFLPPTFETAPAFDGPETAGIFNAFPLVDVTFSWARHPSYPTPDYASSVRGCCFLRRTLLNAVRATTGIGPTVVCAPRVK
jgi:hypothetical protein